MRRGLRLAGVGAILAVAGGSAGARQTPTGLVAQPRCGELPAAVVSRVSAIRDAALARDYSAVGAEADPESFRYSFGDDGGDPVAYWRQADTMGEDVLGAMVAVLDLPCAAADYGTGLRTFVWPAAAEIPYAELSLSEREGLAALYEGFDIDYYYMDGPEDGFYVGWRLYIDEDGRWTAFIAGD